MKLLLSPSDHEEAPWLDDPGLEMLRRMAASLGNPGDTVEITIVDDKFIQKG